MLTAELRRPNDKSNYIKTFNTFKYSVKVFGYLFGIRFVLKNTLFEIIYTVAKYDFLKRGYLLRTAPVQEVGALLK